MESKSLETYFFAAIFFLSSVLVFLILWPYFSAMVISVTLAVIFMPVYRWLLNKLGGREWLSSFIMLLLVLILVLIPVLYFGYQLFGEAKGLYSSIAGNNQADPIYSFLSHTGDLMQKMFPGYSWNPGSYLQNIFGWFSNNIGQIFSSVAGVFINFFLALLGLFYFFKDGERLKDFIVSRSPLSLKHNKDILGRLHPTLNSVIRGALIISILLGITSGLGFLFFGIPNPFFWGLVTIFAAFVPVLGVAIVIGPAVLYLCALGNIGAAIGLLCWGVILVSFIYNVIGPLLMKRGVQIHPLLILLSILGGIQFFGPIGFLAGPLSLGFFLALLDIYSGLIRSSRKKAPALTSDQK